MAVTGVVLFGFVAGHLAGNLLAYKGPEALNTYAHALRTLPFQMLWIARAVLLASVSLHIWAAAALARMSLAARPQAYELRVNQESTYASRTMRYSGVTLGLFVVYHLLHFTFGLVHPDFVSGDVYHNFVSGFRVVPVSAFYIAAMVALAFHLYHGAWSMLQTLGLSDPRFNPLRHAFASLVAVGIAAGNISFPLAVLFGVIE